MRRLMAGLLALALASPAYAACRQALILGLDVSGSVDPTEYRLQLDGLADALGDPAVQDAFLQFPQAPVRLSVFEWSGMTDQRVVLDWVEITDRATLMSVVQALRATQSRLATDRSTAIVSAMRYAHAELQRQDCWQRTFDISGDGAANIGEEPRYLPAEALPGITINALVIGPQNRANTTKNLANVKSLESYFRSFVIQGPGAFTEVAIDYDDFRTAMARKLIKELDAPALSRRGAWPTYQ